MQLHRAASALALATSVVAAAPPSLSQVFKVNVNSLDHDLSTCARQTADGRTIFDKNAAPGSGSNAILNVVWDQIHMMINNAVEAIKAQEYNNPGHYRTRAVLDAFFGIEPNDDPDFSSGKMEIFEYSEEDMWEPARTFFRKMNSVRWNFNQAKKIINDQQPDDEFKTKIMCDGTFMELQTADDEVKDRNGDPIPMAEEDPGQGNWKLKLWEDTRGRNFDAHWYFWYDLSDEKGYVVLDKAGYPEIPGTSPPSPWQIDSRSHKPNPCLGADVPGGQHGNLGTTIMTIPKDCGGFDSDFSDCGSDDGGMNTDDAGAPWSEAIWIVLCPASFTKGALQPSQHPPADGTSLDSQELTSVTLLHELFHITEKRNDDFDKQMPKSGVTDLSTKENFAEIDGVPTSGAGECMYMARWEVADPATESFDALTTRNPESYAWASLAFWLEAIWDRDFSSGACRSD